MEGWMGTLGNMILIGVVGFLVVAGLSLLTMGAPATPLFARRAPAANLATLR
jgi:hypothetical protein